MILFRHLRPLKLMVMAAAMMFTIILGVYYISFLFEWKPDNNFYSFIASELSFPFASFFAQLDLGDHLFRCFKDYIVSPIYFLPSSWWSGFIEPVGQVNTSVIMGAAKGEQEVTCGIPVDLLTMGLMQAFFFGILVVGILFGALLRFLQHLLDIFPHAGIRSLFEAHIVYKIAGIGIFYAQPELFIKNNFSLILTVVSLIIFIKMPKFVFSAPHSPCKNHTIILNDGGACKRRAMD